MEETHTSVMLIMAIVSSEVCPVLICQNSSVPKIHLLGLSQTVIDTHLNTAYLVLKRLHCLHVE